MVDRATQSLVTTALIIFAVLSGLLLVTWQGLKLYRSRLQADIEAQRKTKPQKTGTQSKTIRYPFKGRSAIAKYGARNRETTEASLFESDSDSQPPPSKPLPPTPSLLPSRLQRVYSRDGQGLQRQRVPNQVQIQTPQSRSTYGPANRFDRVRYSPLENVETVRVAANPQDVNFPGQASPPKSLISPTLAGQSVTPTAQPFARHLSQPASISREVHTAPSSPRAESGSDQSFI